MCGIVGFLLGRPELNVHQLEARLAPMLDSLRHRGPDGEGMWSDPPRGIILGHRRLKIMELGSSGQQPIVRGEWVLAYNGEIYNYRQLRGQLEGYGHAFEGDGDAEVVGSALQHWGLEGALQRFDGMFALSAWNYRLRRLFLARDRMGEKPLYYTRVGQDWVFASDLRALRHYPGYSGQVCQRSLALYLRFGYVPHPACIHEGVWKLSPASWLDLGQQVGPQSFWQASHCLRPSGPESTQDLHSLLLDSLRTRLEAKVPFGVLLSGGIDSSLVAALAQRVSQGRLKTFSIGFEKATLNEAPFSRAVAQHLDCDHHEHILTGVEACWRVLEVANVYDEPFADSSQIAMMSVVELARAQVRGVLTGDGGDELFFGYPGTLLTLRRWLSGPGRRLKDCYLDQTTPGFLDPNEILGQPAPKWEDLLPAFASAEPARRLSLWDLHHYLPDDILTKVDRATMGVSLESRAPLLAREVVEYALRQPFPGHSGKPLLKSIVGEYLPLALVDRPKQGFSVPLRDWLAGPLRDWAQDLLCPSRLARQGFFRVDRVEQLWKEQLAKGLHGQRLWILLMFQAWIDNEGRKPSAENVGR